MIGCRQPFHFFLLISSAAALLAVSCADEEEEACEHLCEGLEHCGMFPSVLSAGASGDQGRSSCEYRCVNSDDDLKQSIQQCLGEGGDDFSWEEANWCDEDSECMHLRECVQSTFNTDLPVAGTAGLRMSVGPNSDADSGLDLCREEAAFDWLETSSTENDCTVDNNVAYCEATGISTLELFVIQDGVEYTLPPASCSQVLNNQFIFDDLTSGPFQGGVKVRGMCPGTQCRILDCITDCQCVPVETEGPSVSKSKGPQDSFAGTWCFISYGDEFVVKAADSPVSVVVPMPDAETLSVGISSTTWGTENLSGLLQCEESPTLCSDGHDNDRDGAIDCADSDCFSFCLENSNSLCCDDLDNDADGLVDCQDSDCFGTNVCQAKEDGGV